MVSMMTLYLGVWTFSASGASQIFISVLIFMINGVWLLCVTGILFASFGNKVKKGVDWIGDKVCKREKDRRDKSGGHVTALPSLEVALEMESLPRVSSRKKKEKEKGETLIVNPLMRK